MEINAGVIWRLGKKSCEFVGVLDVEQCPNEKAEEASDEHVESGEFGGNFIEAKGYCKEIANEREPGK